VKSLGGGDLREQVTTDPGAIARILCASFQLSGQSQGALSGTWRAWKLAMSRKRLKMTNSPKGERVGEIARQLCDLLDQQMKALTGLGLEDLTDEEAAGYQLRRRQIEALRSELNDLAHPNWTGFLFLTHSSPQAKGRFVRSHSSAGSMLVFIQKPIHLVNDLYQPLGVSFLLSHFVQATPSFRFIREHADVSSPVNGRTPQGR
jgi:hypothetical protein